MGILCYELYIIWMVKNVWNITECSKLHDFPKKDVYNYRYISICIRAKISKGNSDILKYESGKIAEAKLKSSCRSNSFVSSFNLKYKNQKSQVLFSVIHFSWTE